MKELNEEGEQAAPPPPPPSPGRRWHGASTSTTTVQPHQPTAATPLKSHPFLLQISLTHLCFNPNMSALIVAPQLFHVYFYFIYS